MYNSGNPGGIQREWSSGLFSCFEDPSNCCITCCCPCITFGQIAETVDKGATSCPIGGAIYFILAMFGCQCAYSCTYRSKIRTLYSLKAGGCPDFLVHCCCEYCALCQEYRELKNNGQDPSLGWQENAGKGNVGGNTAPPNVYPGMSR